MKKQSLRNHSFGKLKAAIISRIKSLIAAKSQPSNGDNFSNFQKEDSQHNTSRVDDSPYAAVTDNYHRRYKTFGSPQSVDIFLGLIKQQKYTGPHWAAFFHQRFCALLAIDHAQWKIARKYLQTNKQLPLKKKIIFRAQRAAWLATWGLEGSICQQLKQQDFLTAEEKKLFHQESWETVCAEQKAIRGYYKQVSKIPLATRRRLCQQIDLFRMGWSGSEPLITQQWVVLDKKDRSEQLRSWNELRTAHHILIQHYQATGHLPHSFKRRMALEYEQFWLELYPELATDTVHLPKSH